MLLSVGALNALINLLFWILNFILGALAESLYIRLSSRSLRLHGETRGTDVSDVHLFPVIARHPSRLKRMPLYALFLAGCLIILFPLELLVDSGLSESRQCRPATESSTGVCAGKWNGHSEVGIAASALLTQRLNWVDQHWEHVPEGARKVSRAEEQRSGKKIRGTKVLLENCKVETRIGCGKGNSPNCGWLLVNISGGSFDTVISDSSFTKGIHKTNKLGDLVWDGEMSAAFIFWGSATSGRTRVLRGTETVLTDAEFSRVLKRQTKPWQLSLDPKRTRQYFITCDTDGIPLGNLVKGVAIYRTVQMEQPGVKRTSARNGRIGKLDALNASDVTKAGFALMAEDGSRSCSGKLRVYSTCGTVGMPQAAPFITATLALIVAWFFGRVWVRGNHERPPCDAAAWRRQAHALLRRVRMHERNARKNYPGMPDTPSPGADTSPLAAGSDAWAAYAAAVDTVPIDSFLAPSSPSASVQQQSQQQRPDDPNGSPGDSGIFAWRFFQDWSLASWRTGAQQSELSQRSAGRNGPRRGQSGNQMQNEADDVGGLPEDVFRERDRAAD